MKSGGCIELGALVPEMRPSMSQKDLDMYLESIGIPSQPQIERPPTPHSTDGSQRSTVRFKFMSSIFHEDCSSEFMY